jgi:EamA domain-containing membrane protein RarD
VAGGAGDPLLVAYIVTWVAKHLWSAVAWNPPFLYPATDVLAYSDHLYGLAVMAWPAVAAGAPPTLVVNGIAWAAFFLTSLALFAWLADGSRKIWPACAAAITVSYCAWRTQQLSHPHLIFSPFLPLGLLFFERAIQRRGPMWLMWIGAAFVAAQTVSVASLAVFTLPLVAVYLAILLAIERSDRQVWIACAVALLAVAVCNVPLARHYWALGASFERNAVEV